MRRALRLFPLPVALSLAGCFFLADDVRIEGAERASIPLADNLVGEPCRAEPDPAPRAAETVLDAQLIYCGRWEEPSGRLMVVAAERGDGADLSAAFAEDGWWRADLDGRMTCGDSRTTALFAAAQATVLQCTLRDGGWPYLALAVPLDGRIYLGEGIPANLPSLEAAIAGLSGRGSFADGAGRDRAAFADLERDLAGNLFGTGDMRDFDALLRVAQYYNGLKQFAQAEEKYREALEIHRRLLPEDSPGRGALLMHLALELSNQEQFSEANILFAQAKALIGRESDPVALPRYISYLALHFANQKKYETALDLALTATRLRQRLAADESNRQSRGMPDAGGRMTIALGGQAGGRRFGLSDRLIVDSSQSLYIESAMALELGRHALALDRARDAAAILARYPAAPDWWQTQLDLVAARALAALDRPDQAERQLLRGVRRQRDLFARSRLEFLALAELGKLYAAQDRAAEALAAYRDGLAVIAEAGGGVALKDVAPYFRLLLTQAKTQSGAADRLARELVEAGQLVRGAITTQTIAAAAARLSAGDREVSSLIRAWQDAQRERDRLTQAFNKLAGDETAEEEAVEALRAQLVAAEQETRRLQGQVQAAAPGYNQLVDEPSGLDQVQDLLRPDEAILQILLGEAESYLFLIRPDQVTVRQMALTRAAAGQAVMRLRIPFDAEEVLPHFDVEAAHQLYRHLIAPLETELAEVRHLITVPSGALLSLPLGVLVTEPVDPVTDYDYRHVPWLVDRFALTLAPSIRAFADIRGRAKPSAAPEPFVGFGDFEPVRDPDTLLAGRNLADLCRTDARLVAGLDPLPETAEELQRVAATFSGKAPVLTGPAFTEAALRETDLSRFQVVYFATHGLLPGELDCWNEPSLLVSGPDAGKAAADNGLLEVSDIVGLSLDADLVVLSACNTGGEGQGGGESLTGLARAFFYAGARSLLVSHWKVGSRATVALMTDSFDRLAGGRLTTAEALSRAQARLARDDYYSHPYYWAAFTLVGDGGRTLGSRPPAALAAKRPPAALAAKRR